MTSSASTIEPMGGAVHAELTLRRLELADMEQAARVHRAAFDAALPWLAGLHTADQDRWFYRERMFVNCALWGAFAAADMIGVIAFREGWIDQLYVLPAAQGRGAGSALLQVAKGSLDRLQLFTFQRNARARRFYEARGFRLVRETDGADNEENEPDALYLWISGRGIGASAHVVPSHKAWRGPVGRN